ncbi:MAG: secondary thiamine-phosphate synthase enzyme YjbQ [Pseudomonadota bacterium]
MESINFKTKGRYDFIDMTEKVKSIVDKSKIENGILYLFVPGSTAAITTIEYESGVIEDLIAVFEKIAPEKAHYKHHLKWGDGNGAAHIKSALVGTDLSVPIRGGSLSLGTWQQVVLIDFDEKPRSREVIVQILKAT